jgi:hypothetical protein
MANREWSRQGLARASLQDVEQEKAVMHHDVFISYSSRDREIATAVCATIEGWKIHCWIAPRDVVPGTHYGEALVEAIRSCKVMVLVFSASSNESPQVMREVERAVSANIPIIPFRIEAVRPTRSLEYFLSSPHWLDAMTPPLEKHLQTLARSVRVLLTPPAEREKVGGSHVLDRGVKAVSGTRVQSDTAHVHGAPLPQPEMMPPSHPQLTGRSPAILSFIVLAIAWLIGAVLWGSWSYRVFFPPVGNRYRASGPPPEDGVSKMWVCVTGVTLVVALLAWSYFAFRRFRSHGIHGP